MRISEPPQCSDHPMRRLRPETPRSCNNTPRNIQTHVTCASLRGNRAPLVLGLDLLVVQSAQRNRQVALVQLTSEEGNRLCVALHRQLTVVPVPVGIPKWCHTTVRSPAQTSSRRNSPGIAAEALRKVKSIGRAGGGDSTAHAAYQNYGIRFAVGELQEGLHGECELTARSPLVAHGGVLPVILIPLYGPLIPLYGPLIPLWSTHPPLWSTHPSSRMKACCPLYSCQLKHTSASMSACRMRLRPHASMCGSCLPKIINSSVPFAANSGVRWHVLHCKILHQRYCIRDIALEIAHQT
eukprot:1187985-Prorocentrum_minimum.AAC.4